MRALARYQDAATAMNVNAKTLQALYVRAAVEKHGGVAQAARALRMHRRTVQRILGKRVMA